MNTMIADVEELIASRLAPTRALITSWCGVRYRLCPGTLNTILYRLQQRGRIIRTKHGIYRAMPSVAAPAPTSGTKGGDPLWVLATIPFDGPPIRVAVTLPVSGWCPITHEPQPGSTVTLIYTPDARLLDIADLAWLVPAADWPRDLEAAAVYLHAQAASALGVPVALSARFVLASGVVVECRM